jgi:DNA-binding MarR family transcriptional regulator
MNDIIKGCSRRLLSRVKPPFAVLLHCIKNRYATIGGHVYTHKFIKVVICISLVQLVTKKRIIRKPEGFTKELIIRILTKYDRRRFSDLRNELKITKPMLARHLNSLEAQRKISGKKQGREVYYSLTAKQWNRTDTRIHLFSSSLLHFINRELTGGKADEERLQKLSDLDFVQELSAKVSALALFTIIKSYETQEEWYDASKEIVEQLALGGIVYRKLVYPKPGWIAKDELKKNIEVRAKIEGLYQSMRELYPREMKVMEQVCDDPRVLKDPDTGETLFEYAAPPRVFELKTDRKSRSKNKTPLAAG